MKYKKIYSKSPFKEKNKIRRKLKFWEKQKIDTIKNIIETY